MRPYHNIHIISVIRDMFFTGGHTLFASRFSHLFLVHDDDKGVPTRKVPVPMVTLVAMAVSCGHGVAITLHTNFID